MSVSIYTPGSKAVSINVSFSENGGGVLSPAAPYTDVEFDLNTFLQSSVTPKFAAWSVILGTPASVLAMELRLEGSKDGVTWATLDTYTGTVKTLRSISFDRSVRYIRARVFSLDLTSSTSTTVTIALTLYSGTATKTYERGSRFVSISTNFFDVGTTQFPANPTTENTAGLEAYLQQSVLPRRIAWDVLLGTPANISSMSILLEGSLNGVDWFTLDTYTTVANTLRHIVDKPVRYLRANISAIAINTDTDSTVEVGISL